MESSAPLMAAKEDAVSAEDAIVSPAIDQFSTHPPKKKRNLPGMPDPDAEVIALTPNSLLAKNKFVCEICNKGFQRDQNLQLHRRGHNLPWKLKQRTGKEVKKRVYVCPEASCVHHHPSRALGDLTGIKKHFCRKHGEKKFKCERCSKKYAVQSDWKAHMKTCGSREYRCDCGTLFTRRDSFITHRAFCDALARETATPQSPANSGENMKIQTSSSPPPPPLTPSTGVVSPVLSIQSSELPENQGGDLQQQPGPTPLCTANTNATTITAEASGSSASTVTSAANVITNRGVFASIFASSTSASPSLSTQPSSSSYSELQCSPMDPISLSLSSSLYFSSNASSSFYPANSQDHYRPYSSTLQPALSATALLQKAAQMGATSSGSSFLRGLGLAISDPSDLQDKTETAAMENNASTPPEWLSTVKVEDNSMASGIGLGLPSNPSSGLNDYMIVHSTVFPSRPATLDLLGLGVGPDEASEGGFSAFLTSMGGEFGAGGSSVRWDDPSDRKSSLL